MENEEQGFVEQDTALESMRASDFDCYSAYGEVVDNSIQANADDIRIEFQENSSSKSRAKKIGRVLFADNGTGMDSYELHRCLKLGHSSRYNDRSGIGRFGVGMTLGAIHECQRIEVFSKQKGSDWYYTYLDLEEVREKKLKFIPRPIPKRPKDEIVNYINQSGTLVVWSKYDKQVDPYETVINETKIWLGRTFRKFLWGEAKGYGEIDIRVDGEIIKAIDPLYYNKHKTGFEEEEKALLHKPTTLDWLIPEEVRSKKQKSTILLRTSLLPDSYRRNRGQGGDEFSVSRYIDRNEGISILRNDREVFYGLIPYATKLHGSSEADRMVSRFIGCEICFSAELDQEFSVKNIKRGAVPIRELKKEIEELLAPTFRSERENIRDRWEERNRNQNNDENDKNSDINISNSHVETNRILKENKDSLLKKDKAGKEENDQKIGKKVKPDVQGEELDKIIQGLRENGITIDEREFIGDTFIDIEHGNKLKTLFYNTNSTFYKSYKEILEEIQLKNESVAKDYKVLIDLIFVGYMLAESQIDPEEVYDGATFSQEIKSHWAISLTKILKKWKN